MAAISIIVPVYNTEKYLRQCIESLINQTYEDIEIILVNDGSRDNSGGICDEYAKSDNRIKVIHKENEGLSNARNTGVNVSIGKYIMFVDSDDWIDIETCKVVLNVAVEHSCDLVFWSYVREYGNESKPKKVYSTDKDFVVFSQEEVKNKLHRRVAGLIGEELRNPEHNDSLSTVWGKLYSSKSVKDSKFEFVDTKIIGNEDALYNLYVLGDVKKAVYVDKTLYHYRKNNQASFTKLQSYTLYKKWKKLFMYIREYIDNNNLGHLFDDALDNRICLSVIGLGIVITKSKEISLKQKLSLISEILNEEEYKKAFKKLSLRNFTLKWKLFFMFAKYRLVLPLYFLLWIIVRITTIK